MSAIVPDALILGLVALVLIAIYFGWVGLATERIGFVFTGYSFFCAACGYALAMFIG